MADASRWVSVVGEDPELAQHLPAARMEPARRAAVARLCFLQRGEWSPPERRPAEAGALGLLVLEGVLVRAGSISGGGVSTSLP